MDKVKCVCPVNHPASAAWCPLKALVVNKGYQFDLAAVFTRGYDKISSGDKAAPYAVGTFKWPIPNQYKKVGAADNTAKNYATANQQFASDATGKCTISKAGSGDFSKNAGDASSTPPNWN